MKKALFMSISLLAMCTLRSQSIAEARKMLYYERYNGAALYLHNLLRQDPNNAEAWWLLTQAYIHTGRTKKIKDSLLLLPPTNTQNPLWQCAYGAVLLQENKNDSASALFAKALSATKEKDPQVLLAIAKAHQEARSGDTAYAIELLGKAIKRDKHNALLYTALGNAYRKAMDGTASYRAYQDALAQDARYADAMFKLGKIFVSQGNTDMYLKYFNDAVSADPLFAPAWYELYYHYYFRDVNRAMDCLNHYIAASDSSLKNDYLVTDLLYTSKKYNEAISRANQLIQQQGPASEPRLYKLIAYSYKELNDSAKALAYMQQYFTQQADTGFVVKDFETMGEIYEKMPDRTDSAAIYFAKAAEMEKDSLKRTEYDKKLADLYKKMKDYPNQALYLGKYYQGNSHATNLDLFNWALAHFMAKNYLMADSAFGLYETKYPDQEFGYYWRARSDAAIDTAMTTGMAIPHYLKAIDIAAKDTTSRTNRKHLVEAYGYIAAFKANTEKDYTGAIAYFEKLLVLDPSNQDAHKYVEILKKNQARAEARASAKTDNKPESSKTND